MLTDADGCCGLQVTEALACIDSGDIKEAQLRLDRVPDAGARDKRSWIELVQVCP
jgi:hypothetical protein